MTMLYDGPIIDPHHHLWDLGLGRHAWLAPSVEDFGGLGDLAQLRRNYLPDDYLRDAAGHHVVATVHVEAGWDVDDCVGETRWLESLEKIGGVAARYVARVPLASAETPELIEAQAAFPRVVGIRDILSWSENPAQRFATRSDLMRDPVWRAGLSALVSNDLVFDLMVYSSQLDEAARLIGDFPNQLFVLEHGGSPIDRDAEGMRRWREGLAAVARRPNVLLKISDLVAYDHQWTLDSLREVVLRCLDCFGPERAMFASDFPVAGLHATFDQVYGAFKTIVSGLSVREQRALFFGNAERTYRIEVASSAARSPAREQQQGENQ
jgi:predicted TIM-barrel fold metal-dependent hydrolase